ncbi:O-antigen ligase family protein [bacterium]|nr:O-antigen ligase family protein [candidate division CSSED10-310 bacterium]
MKRGTGLMLIGLAVAAVSTAAVLVFVVPHLDSKWLLAAGAGFILLVLLLVCKDTDLLLAVIFMLGLFLPAAKRLTPIHGIPLGNPPFLGVWSFDVPLAAALLLGLIRLFSGKGAPRRRSPYDEVFIAGLVFCALSFANAASLDIAMYKWIYQLKYYLIFRWSAHLLGVRSRLPLIVGAFLVAVSLQSGLGIFQHATGSDVALWIPGDVIRYEHLPKGEILRRVGGNWKPNSASQIYQISLGLLFSMLITTGAGARRWIVAALFCLNMAAMVFTLSRGGWFGFLFSIPVILLLHLQAARGRRRLQMLLAVMAGAVLLAGLVAMLREPLANRLAHRESVSGWGRMQMYRGAMAMIAAHPLLGVGLNNYVANALPYDAFAGYYRIPVHNIYLLYGAETGLPRLFVFLVFLALLIRDGWRCRYAPPFARTIAFGLTGAMLGLYVRMLVAMSLEDVVVASCFYFMAGMLPALAAWRDKRNGRRENAQ